MDHVPDSTDLRVPDEPGDVKFRVEQGKPVTLIARALKSALEKLVGWDDFIECGPEDIDEIGRIVRYRLYVAAKYLHALKEMVPDQEVASCILAVRGFFFGPGHLKELMNARESLGGGLHIYHVLTLEKALGLKTDERSFADDLFVIGEEGRSDPVRHAITTAQEYSKALNAKLTWDT